MFQSIKFLPFSFGLPEAEQAIISSAHKYRFGVWGYCYWSAKFLVRSKSPLLFRFPTFNELVLKFLYINFLFLLFIFQSCFLIFFFTLLPLILFLLIPLLYLLLLWVNLHGINNVIINNPNIILIIRSYWFSCIGPVRIIIIIAFMLICINLLQQIMNWWLDFLLTFNDWHLLCRLNL